jgi:hypothetical protein
MSGGIKQKPPRRVTWRGVELVERPKCGLRHQCLMSAGEHWKAETFDSGKKWYARLKLGCHRFNGEGATLAIALELARDAAFSVYVGIEQQLDQTAGSSVAVFAENSEPDPE